LPRGATLASLKFNARVRELEFHLFLQNERIDGDAIVRRLAEAGIPVPNFNKTQAIRYLKGLLIWSMNTMVSFTSRIIRVII